MLQVRSGAKTAAAAGAARRHHLIPHLLDPKIPPYKIITSTEVKWGNLQNTQGMNTKIDL
jgi:hypothetical protein